MGGLTFKSGQVGVLTLASEKASIAALIRSSLFCLRIPGISAWVLIPGGTGFSSGAEGTWSKEKVIEAGTEPRGGEGLGYGPEVCIFSSNCAANSHIVLSIFLLAGLAVNAAIFNLRR